MDNKGVERKRQRIANFEKIKGEECKDKIFKLVGAINYFEIFPAFVIPIFICEQNGKKYMQEGEYRTLTLNGFYEIEPYKDLRNRKVASLENVNKNAFTSQEYTIDSKPVFIFQISANDYFVGDADSMKVFLKNYTTENPILKEEIADFMQCG